jgi:hypothetical protein
MRDKQLLRLWIIISVLALLAGLILFIDSGV